MNQEITSLQASFLERRGAGARARDVAAALGVPEAALLGACCGAAGPVQVTRLRPEFEAILGAMPSLGAVKTITRNETVVLEVEGAYGGVEFFGAMGQSVSDIDLRIFVRRWAHGFLVVEETRKQPRRSLQFFDAHGTAIHKVYATDETREEALQALIEAYRSSDQQPSIRFEPRPAAEPPAPDDAIDRAGLREAWLAMKDTHEFFGLLRRFGVERQQALRLVGDDLAAPLEPGCMETLLRRASEGEVPLMVFVGNAGLIQIHTGVPRRIVEMDGWLNVMDPRFNLHVRSPELAAAWRVRKPTVDGIVTAVEFYDRAGEQVALFNGKRKPGSPEFPAWRSLADGLPRADR
jgi:putative hemin transport protein